METVTIKGNLTALAPIHHGGSGTHSTTKPILLLPNIIINPETGETEIDNIPAIHGNAIRGYIRRLIMKDMLDLLDYKLDSKKVYHFLFTGGILESLDPKDKGAINLSLKKEIRELLPPISLLGSAIGNQMFDGKLKVGIADIVCSETKHYFTDFEDKTFSSYNLQDSDFGTRLDSLKQDSSKEVGKDITDVDEEKEKDEQNTQMKYEFDTLIRGTKFTHEFILEDCNTTERACFIRMLRLWNERPYLGGKSGTGYGKISMDYVGVNYGDDKEYLTFISENKEQITNLLDEMVKKWKG